MQQVCFPVITTVTCNKCEHRIALIRGDKVPRPRRAEDQLCAVAPSPIAHRSWRWCSRPGALQGPPLGGSTAPPLQEGVHPPPAAAAAALRAAAAAAGLGCTPSCGGADLVAVFYRDLTKDHFSKTQNTRLPFCSSPSAKWGTAGTRSTPPTPPQGGTAGPQPRGAQNPLFGGFWAPGAFWAWGAQNGQNWPFWGPRPKMPL